MTMAAEKKQVVLSAYGSFVFKQDIRQVLNIRSLRNWQEEIALLTVTMNECFAQEIKQYRRSKKIPVDLARKIILTILERSGEEVELRFDRQQ